MKSSKLAANVSTGVLVLCAVMVTGLVVRRELLPAASAREGASSPAIVRDWREYASTGQRSGPSIPSVTIVEFSDFQCPYCRVAAARLDSLRDEFPSAVEVVYRHFPLPNHEHAAAAALASECAGEQGRFWQMHDQLFSRQADLGRIPWNDLALAAGVGEEERFRLCMDGRRGDPVLERDAAAARRLGVRVTPTLLINERQVLGVPPLDSLRAYVVQALAASSTTSNR